MRPARPIEFAGGSSCWARPLTGPAPLAVNTRTRPFRLEEKKGCTGIFGRPRHPCEPRADGTVWSHGSAGQRSPPRRRLGYSLWAALPPQVGRSPSECRPAAGITAALKGSKSCAGRVAKRESVAELTEVI